MNMYILSTETQTARRELFWCKRKNDLQIW